MLREPHELAPKSSKSETSTSECPETFAKWYCLNGATCFAVKIKESSLYNCWCPVGFHGLRCDYKYVERRRQQQLDEYHQEEHSGAEVANSLDTQNELALTLTLRRPYPRDSSVQDGGRNEHNIAITPSRQQQQHQVHTSRAVYLILYNLLILILLVILIILLTRYLRRSKTPPMDRNESLSSIEHQSNHDHHPREEQQYYSSNGSAMVELKRPPDCKGADKKSSAMQESLRRQIDQTISGSSEEDANRQRRMLDRTNNYRPNSDNWKHPRRLPVQAETCSFPVSMDNLS